MIITLNNLFQLLRIPVVDNYACGNCGCDDNNNDLGVVFRIMIFVCVTNGHML